jgi:hypothetical protein
MNFIGACGAALKLYGCTGPVPVLGTYVRRTTITCFIGCVRHEELGHWDAVDTIALPSALGSVAVGGSRSPCGRQ